MHEESNSVAAAKFKAEINQRIDAFKSCLLKSGVDETLDQHVFSHGQSILGENAESLLRSTIAQNFGIDISCVTIVGSAKLGFSTKPGQCFRHFSLSSSDLDVAIVSRDLFSKIWGEVFEMERAGEYFNFDRFKHYHFRGWIRPDKLPPQQEYETSKNWWNFFKNLSSSEASHRIKVSAGLYFDSYFLRQYQATSLLGLREKISTKV